MPRATLAVFLSFFLASAGELGEITADKLTRKDGTIFAQGNVTLVSEDYYIAAPDFTYDQKTKIAHIKGEARIYEGSKLMLVAKNIQIDFAKDAFSLDSLYLQNEMGLWISARESKAEEGVYYFREGVVSGCDIQNPIWHLDASSGSFDKSTSVMTLWNARVYVGKMPFLYIPYLSLSTKDERKSGFLYPNFGIIDQEGIYYQQSLYIAPHEFWDMTLTPQVRTDRGAGFSGEFRLATPNDNLFLFQTKYFYNFDSYVQKYSAKNQHIYGFDLDFNTHDGTGIFKRFPSLRDGFFADLTFMNDIDYLRLDDVSKKITDRIHTSKLNYFLHSQDHYLGIYNKYFFNFGTTDNRETLQLLPGVQYHKFLDSLFWKDLMYSIDLQTNNVMRQRGYGYVENTVAMPLGIELSLFGDYVSLGLATDLNFTNVSFHHAQNMIVPSGGRAPKFANFFTANYVATMSSDIARDYGSFLHTMQLRARASGPYYRYNTELFDAKIYEAYAKESINAKNIYNLWSPISIVDFDANKPVLDLSLSQYFYTASGRTAFYYNLSQRLNLETQKYLFASPMQNEIGSSPIDGLDLRGTLEYSFLYQDIQSASAKLDFSRWRMDGSFGYYYKKLFATDAASIDANFLHFALRSDLGYFAMGGDMSYDFIHNQVKDWSLTLSTDIRCFGISFKFGQEFAPMIVDRADQPIRTVTNQYIQLQLRVLPLGEFGASYRFKQK